MEHRAPRKHICCPYTPSIPGGGVKTNFFLKAVMVHINLKEMECSAPCKHIFCPNTSSTVGSGQKAKPFFLNMAMLHIKLKGRSIDQHQSKNVDRTHTPDFGVGLKIQILKLCS